ncbi:DNA recombination protein RmuC [Microbacterium sp. P06]|uniref:DNA recombination protein RmuC n=1 Tax=unclassified Microbacterium TaxID=2609290 RepID=UPI0037457D83
MDALALFLTAIGCLALGLVAGFAFASARSSRERADAAGRLAAAEAARAGVQAQLDHQQLLYRELSGQARADQAAREERERREQTVLRALAPVRDSLDSMQRKVEDLERERGVQFGSLSEQLRRAHESDEVLRTTTEALASAMRSSSSRGVWGETQLRRVVEAAGLLRFVDFDTQATVTTVDGTGRPDMIVRLPGDKTLAIDAKVPLDAYLEASAIPFTAQGEEGARRLSLLDRHARAVRAHVDALAKKGYWTGLASSPEFVICFIPSESLLSAALEHDPALLDYAFGKRVALASPVNLWAVLKTVAYTWTQQDVSQEARQLVALGTELYDRIGVVAGHADDLRRAIERTVDSYNKFAGSLESRVLVSARKFPGIDDTRLEAAAAPPVIDRSTRRWTAPELLDGLDEADDRLRQNDDTRTREGDESAVAASGPVIADIGDLRGRL